MKQNIFNSFIAGACILALASCDDNSWNNQYLNGFEDTLAPFVFAGPSIGLLVGHSKLDCFDFPFGEFGLDFGIGAEIKRNWQLSVSYNIGFTYAMKDKILTNYSARNNTLSLRLAYLF